MVRSSCVDAACRFRSQTKAFVDAAPGQPCSTRLLLTVGIVGLGLAACWNQAFAQAKGSPDHIKAVTSAVDSASINANSATSKD